MVSRPSVSVSIGFIIGAIVLVFMAQPALAHRVTIFAWVEGEMIHTESKFSGGKKAVNAVVEVQDAQGKKLLQGNTDENGRFSFKIPQKSELKVVLQAGMGHQGSWTIPLSELEDAMTDTDQLSPDTSPPAEQVSDTSPVVVTKADTCVDREEIQIIMEKTMDRKLKPVIGSLNKLSEPKQRPSIMEVLAGIGYIIGLVGAGAYIHYRRKVHDSSS